MTKPFIIGSRGSDLALWQANYVKAALETNFPDKSFAIKIIQTTGDRTLDVALSKIGDKGLFTSEIEAELLGGTIDLAVHSLKDLQTAQPDGLAIGAVCRREIPNDVLVSKAKGTINDLPRGAKVATGSLRRRSQLLNYRPDLEIVEIRGNVPTRLRKFDDSDLDAMILAYAGIHRLGFDECIGQIIPFDIMIPAVGQGAVAIEIRDTEDEIRGMTATLDHAETRISIIAERAFLRRLEGGCQVPIGGYAAVDDDEVTLTGIVGSLDGSIVYREAVNGPAIQAQSLGLQLAESLIGNGADELLDAIRAQGQNSAEASM